MKNFFLLVLLNIPILNYSQFGNTELLCQCMSFTSYGSETCTDFVSYTVQAGTGGCCTGVANSSVIGSMTMGFNTIKSISYIEAPGSVGQFLCC